MRILIDTNIIITLEDSSKTLADSFSEFSRACLSNHHDLLVHPASFADIENDEDEGRRLISLSRLRKYAILQHPPQASDDDLNSLGLPNNTRNDKTDNQILYAVYKNAVHLLVTEDRTIHKKAKRLNITSRVHYIQQAATFLQRLYQRHVVRLPKIEEVLTYNIDIESRFFDSLREDYPEFDEWYKRISRDGRKAWIYRDDNDSPAAICIFKEEYDAIVTDDNRGLRGRVLKLCTFKVGEKIRGMKIGELLLKAAFRYATEHACEHIYITMNPLKQAFLEDLVEDFGFSLVGKCRNDDVYVKKHPTRPIQVDCSPLDYNIRYYPLFVCDDTVQKYLVPIRPHFHDLLFPDIQVQGSLLIHSSGNAIKQAYLCHAKIKRIRPGDILLFYRTDDLKAITSLGIVESSQDFTAAEKIMPIVSKRTIYSYDYICEMAKRRTKVILFRATYHFSSYINYKWLIERSVINGPIRTITTISDEAYRRIINECDVRCLHADKAALCK